MQWLTTTGLQQVSPSLRQWGHGCRRRRWVRGGQRFWWYVPCLVDNIRMSCWLHPPSDKQLSWFIASVFRVPSSDCKRQTGVNVLTCSTAENVACCAGNSGIALMTRRAYCVCPEVSVRTRQICRRNDGRIATSRVGVCHFGWNVTSLKSAFVGIRASIFLSCNCEKLRPYTRTIMMQ